MQHGACLFNPNPLRLEPRAAALAALRHTGRCPPRLIGIIHSVIDRDQRAGRAPC